MSKEELLEFETVPPTDIAEKKMIKNYKNELEKAILEHGSKAIGSTFADLIIEKDDKVNLLMEKAEKNKGFIGNLFQYAYYGIDINPDKNPDFEKAGIELKVAGYRKNKDGSLSADQRLVLSSIDFSEYAKGIELKESSLIKKCNRMLMFYFYSKSAHPLGKLLRQRKSQFQLSADAAAGRCD